MYLFQKEFFQEFAAEVFKGVFFGVARETEGGTDERRVSELEFMLGFDSCKAGLVPSELFSPPKRCLLSKAIFGYFSPQRYFVTMCNFPPTQGA